MNAQNSKVVLPITEKCCTQMYNEHIRICNVYFHAEFAYIIRVFLTNTIANRTQETRLRMSHKMYVGVGHVPV